MSNISKEHLLRLFARVGCHINLHQSIGTNFEFSRHQGHSWSRPKEFKEMFTLQINQDQFDNFAELLKDDTYE